MASTPISSALAAYNAAAKAMGTPGIEPNASGPSFGELLQKAGDQALKTGATDEKQSLLATSGLGNVAEIVTAVSDAEVTLQTVTAIRDRVVAAYQEILRMPI
jgi:flagellar hook-basal body complex protein FliE